MPSLGSVIPANAAWKRCRCSVLSTALQSDRLTPLFLAPSINIDSDVDRPSASGPLAVSSGIGVTEDLLLCDADKIGKPG